MISFLMATNMKTLAAQTILLCSPRPYVVEDFRAATLSRDGCPHAKSALYEGSLGSYKGTCAWDADIHRLGGTGSYERVGLALIAATRPSGGKAFTCKKLREPMFSHFLSSWPTPRSASLSVRCKIIGSTFPKSAAAIQLAPSGSPGEPQALGACALV